MTEGGFRDLGLGESLLQAIDDAGYTEPTPIQEKAIPYLLMGRDVMGCAQTGTGKTASFTLPMIEILAQGRARARLPRSLILEPTRELATQVSDQFEIYGKYAELTKALLIGGVQFAEQTRLLERGVDILIATPGRLIDHFERGHILLSDVKLLVIDESDRMLDMGFIPDVEKIISLLPAIRQTVMFSATMPPEIRTLAERFLMNPKEIAVDPPATVAERVDQFCIMVPEGRKRQTLRDLLRLEEVRNALIFCNRKRDVGTLHRFLEQNGFSAGALHGDMDQYSRTETLESFKNGDIRLLVCSDVAARGLDIEAMSHVFNFDVPINPDDYVHRIGRTGRAGRRGRAITIATEEEDRHLAAIQKISGRGLRKISVSNNRRDDPPARERGRDGDSHGNGGREERRGYGRQEHRDDRQHEGGNEREDRRRNEREEERRKGRETRRRDGRQEERRNGRRRGGEFSGRQDSARENGAGPNGGDDGDGDVLPARETGETAPAGRRPPQERRRADREEREEDAPEQERPPERSRQRKTSRRNGETPDTRQKDRPDQERRATGFGAESDIPAFMRRSTR